MDFRSLPRDEEQMGLIPWRMHSKQKPKRHKRRQNLAKPPTGGKPLSFQQELQFAKIPLCSGPNNIHRTIKGSRFESSCPSAFCCLTWGHPTRSSRVAWRLVVTRQLRHTLATISTICNWRAVLTEVFQRALFLVLLGALAVHQIVKADRVLHEIIEPAEDTENPE